MTLIPICVVNFTILFSLNQRLSDELFKDCFKDVCDELDCLNTSMTNNLLDAEFRNFWIFFFVQIIDWLIE